MKYTVEENLDNFKAWSGGKDTLDELWAHDVVGRAEEYIEMIFADREELPTDTEINDILWFERDEIYRYCGIYDAVYNSDSTEDDEEEEEEEE